MNQPAPKPSDSFHPPHPTITDRRTLHKGRKFDFEQITVRSPAGRTMTRELVRHPGAVVVVPVRPDGQIVLIRNFRNSVGRWLYECCAGTLEHGEPPQECALRELIEETGYQAAAIVSLGAFYTTPGMTDELMHAFVATGLTHVGQRLEEDETIEVVPVAASEALAMIDRGELMDGKSIAALLMAERRGLLTVA